jgi:hypothetical protein
MRFSEQDLHGHLTNDQQKKKKEDGKDKEEGVSTTPNDTKIDDKLLPSNAKDALKVLKDEKPKDEKGKDTKDKDSKDKKDKDGKDVKEDSPFAFTDKELLADYQLSYALNLMKGLVVVKAMDEGKIDTMSTIKDEKKEDKKDDKK